uniref:DUF4259 domain-containing protein n=2 Tax=Enterocloster TaxID=2719313 RepID=UPI0025AF8699|nr:DUF4259 domain-containing protein [Enterocloster clostridioformis]
MGCWGITAFESDAGLDAVGLLREHLPENGRLELENLIEILRRDSWNVPPDAHDGQPHTSPMALAEIMVKFLDQDMEGLDHEGEWAAQERKFRNVTSFSASKESVQWLRGYITDTLKHAKENASQENNCGGWFKKEDWISWQKHMEGLIGRLDVLLASPENRIQLISALEQKTGSTTDREKENRSTDVGIKSEFFEEVSKLAEARGFEDKGVEHGLLQLYLEGKLAAQVDESGSMLYTPYKEVFGLMEDVNEARQRIS